MKLEYREFIHLNLREVNVFLKENPLLCATL